MKDALRARATSADWIQDLPWALLGMRTAPHEESMVSAAENVYGSPLVVPGQFLTVPEPPAEPFLFDLRQAMSQFLPTQPKHNVTTAKQPLAQLPPDLLQAEFVLVRKDGAKPPLTPQYEGPYKVLGRLCTLSCSRWEAALKLSPLTA